MFTTELEMSQKFEKFVINNFGNAYLKECQGLFGTPDFIFYEKKNGTISIISIELKLEDWQRAAKQAFRYKSFSNLSYVVLSRKNFKSALNNIDLFKKYNIGLAKFDEVANFEILFKPLIDDPYSEGLQKKVLANIANSRKKIKNISTLYA